MKLLLDTCVVSEIRRSSGNPDVKNYVAGRLEEDLCISAVTVGELYFGITLMAEGRRKYEIVDWLSVFELEFASRTLPVDAEIARVWGEIAARCRRLGRPLATTDGLIAATAVVHRCYVVTRDVSHFEPTGVLLVNPWETES